MSINNLLYQPEDTFYLFAQSYATLPRKQSQKRIEFRKVFRKREEYIPLEQYERIIQQKEQEEEEEEEQCDPSVSTIKDGDTCYFPPGFHYSPAATIKHSHDQSPWQENFGKTGKKKTKEGKQSRGKSQKESQSSRKRRRRAPRSEKDIFTDMLVDLLKLLLPPVGFILDYKRRQHRTRSGSR